MLKHRILTALVLIPLVLGGVFGLPTFYFALALAFFVAVGAFEWSRMIGFDSNPTRVAYSIFVLALLIPTYDSIQAESAVWLWSIAGVWWLFSIYKILSYRGAVGIERRMIAFNVLVGIVLLVPTWSALVFLHSQFDEGPWLVAFVLVLIMVADSGAYFVGRKLGKRKLAPLVSPGKTIEGMIGALVATAIYSGAAIYQFGYRDYEWLLMIVVCAVIVLFSIAGDLLESLYKRRAGMKDSGSIFPGHGGVMDRIDSVTAAAPLFALAYWWLEYG